MKWANECVTKLLTSFWTLSAKSFLKWFSDFLINWNTQIEIASCQREIKYDYVNKLCFKVFRLWQFWEHCATRNVEKQCTTLSVTWVLTLTWAKSYWNYLRTFIERLVYFTLFLCKSQTSHTIRVYLRDNEFIICNDGEILKKRGGISKVNLQKYQMSYAQKRFTIFLYFILISTVNCTISIRKIAIVHCIRFQGKKIFFSENLFETILIL